MTMPDQSAFDDPDQTVQVEDDDPETLAAEPVDFDPDLGGDDGEAD
jgi:hypothetical protein